MGAVLVPRHRPLHGPDREGRPARPPARRRQDGTAAAGQPAHRAPRPSGALSSGGGPRPAPLPGRGRGLLRLRRRAAPRAPAPVDARRPRAPGRGLPADRQPPSLRELSHRQDRPRRARPGLRPRRREDWDDAREARPAGPRPGAAHAPGGRPTAGAGRGGLHLVDGRERLHPSRASGQGVHRGRRRLPDRAVATARLPPRERPVHALPRPPDDQPVSLPVLPASGPDDGRGLLARGARSRRGRPGRGAADRGNPAAGALRRRGRPNRGRAQR